MGKYSMIILQLNIYIYIIFNLVPKTMAYHTEFKLLSCKYILRCEDADNEELICYKEHLEREGFIVNNLSELFIPLRGEEKRYFNEDIATSELRIRGWSWTVSGKTYILLDVNSWPGDNENGVISIKDQSTNTFEVLCSNNDANLSLNEHSTYNEFFEERLEFFRHLRESLSVEENMIDFDIEGIEEFRDSVNGKESIYIENVAWNRFHEYNDCINKEHDRLRNLYVSEFKITNRVLRCTPELLDEIGYKLKPSQPEPLPKWCLSTTQAFDLLEGAKLLPADFFRSLGWSDDEISRAKKSKALPSWEALGLLAKPFTKEIVSSSVSLTHIDWEFEDNVYKLVFINDSNWYKNKIYMLGDNGKICTKVFTNFLLSTNTENGTPLILALYKRVHSIYEILLGLKFTRLSQTISGGLIREYLDPISGIPMEFDPIPAMPMEFNSVPAIPIVYTPLPTGILYHLYQVTQ